MVMLLFSTTITATITLPPTANGGEEITGSYIGWNLVNSNQLSMAVMLARLWKENMILAS